MLRSIDRYFKIELLGLLGLVILAVVIPGSVECASLKCPQGMFYDIGLDSCAHCRGTNNCPPDQSKVSTRKPLPTTLFRVLVTIISPGKYGSSQAPGYAYYNVGLDNCRPCSTICNAVQLREFYGIVRCKQKCPEYYNDKFVTKAAKRTGQISKAMTMSSTQIIPFQQTLPKANEDKVDVTFGIVLGIIALVVGIIALVGIVFAVICNIQKIRDNISKCCTKQKPYVRPEQPQSSATDCGHCVTNNSSLSGSTDSSFGSDSTYLKESAV